MRLGHKGKYRITAKLYKLEKTDEYEPIFADNAITFRYKHSNGEKLNKEEYKLFSNWVMQSSNIVIETNAIESFEKGDKITTDDGDFMISRVIEHVDPVHLNGRKRIVNKRVVLFCE